MLSTDANVEMGANVWSMYAATKLWKAHWHSLSLWIDSFKPLEAIPRRAMEHFSHIDASPSFCQQDGSHSEPSEIESIFATYRKRLDLSYDEDIQNSISYGMVGKFMKRVRGSYSKTIYKALRTMTASFISPFRLKHSPFKTKENIILLSWKIISCMDN
eukprot:TRINITY_DN8354_c1_g1_i1.p1 TRINITY_DN8354_c1_g1~~TRINITY_DN8354_c1_g1_i1.p1  ORF type:complete len:159 (-),score=15.30 TRINITY_DN8354_c1_g1_i1:54-530(-)